MENQIINKKRSIYVWVIIILLILGIVGSFFSFISGLINIKALLEISSKNDLIKLGLTFVSLCLFVFYFVKLYNLKHDVVKWTNIMFSFFVVRILIIVSLYINPINIISGFLVLLPYTNPIFIALIFILLISFIAIWITFIKHLKKQKLNKKDDYIHNIYIIGGEKLSKLLFFKSWIKNNKKLVIISSIIVFITIIVPLVMIFGVKIISKIKCGEDGYLNGNLNKGYNCSYQILKTEYTKSTQCISSIQFCSERGKIENGNSCFYDGVDLTNKLKVDQNGNFYVEEGPIVCSYCCGLSTNKIINKSQNKKFKYNPRGPYPSPIVDIDNMINARGERVDKFTNGTFKIIETNEIFNYKERLDSPQRYNPDIGDRRDYNNNAVNECITKNCSFVYFKNETNNEQGRVALFNDLDSPITGKIIEVKFLSDHVWYDEEPNPLRREDVVVYTVQPLDGGNTVNDSEDLCVSYKGGDIQCHSPRFKKGDEIIFSFRKTFWGVYLSSEIIKTQLISYQYSMVPDTGEVFPVVER